MPSLKSALALQLLDRLERFLPAIDRLGKSCEQVSLLQLPCPLIRSLILLCLKCNAAGHKLQSFLPEPEENLQRDEMMQILTET